MRPTLLAAVLSVAALAACGDNSSGSGSATSSSRPSGTTTATAPSSAASTTTAPAPPPTPATPPAASSSAPPAHPDWLTFGAGSDRRGFVSNGPDPGGLKPGWSSDDLDGALYGEPIVSGGRVVVATQHDTVYAFDVAT